MASSSLSTCDHVIRSTHWPDMSVPPAFLPEIIGTASNLPRSTTWVSSFDDLFNKHKQSMFDNGDNGPDVGILDNAIKSAASIGVDPRIILCIIMQESHGDVGVSGGGVMQANESPSFPGEHFPQVGQQQVNEMVNAGTQHFRSNLTNYVGLPPGQWDDNKIYTALRFDNSGSADAANLANPGQFGVPTCVSDIAYRLQGRVN